MSNEAQYFTIRASASRLDKGLLAIPQKFRGWFPGDKGPIQVVFDDDDKPKTLTFHPYNSVAKENRIFGLAGWFSKRGVREGDIISVAVEDERARLYRIALDRYVRERKEREARAKLRSAGTELEAEQELAALSVLVRRRPRELAQQELMRIAQQSPRQPRPRVSPAAKERHEGVPSGIRVLLRELHGGKCQLCSFTFQKRNGGPYFEIHHLDPEVGHHPTNLLVLCPNCHAQVEHATVADFKWVGGWLVGLTINGRRTSVRQPLSQGSIIGTVVICILAASMQIGRVLVR